MSIGESKFIHLNGRAYDYNLGRFLSVDPFIQAPGNSQSMNPYSYIMNNPLAGTDPSGYIAECDGGDFACQWDHSIGKIFGLPRSLITAQYNGMKTAQTKSNSSDNKSAANKGSTKDNDSVCQNEANCLTVIGSSYAMSHAIPLDPGARALSGQWLSDVLSRLRDASAFLRSNPHMIIIPAIIPTQLGDSSCASGGCGNPLFSQGKDGDKPSGIVITGGTGSPTPDPDDEDHISNRKMHQRGKHFNKHGREMGYSSQKEYELAAKQFARKNINNSNAKIHEGIWNGKGSLNGQTQRVISYNGKSVVYNPRNGQVIDFYKGTEMRGLINIKRIR